MKFFTNQKSSEDKKKGRKKQPDNAVDLQEEIIDSIVDYLKQFYGKDFSETIVIWTTNQQNQVIVRDNDFSGALCLALDNAHLHVISKANILFEYQKPPEGNNFHEAMDGLFIEIRSITNPQAVFLKAKACITSVLGFGTLSQNEYFLDPKQKTIYHIGRGEIGRYETYLNNDIVIKADESDPEQKEKNRNVSSTHAEIVFKNNIFHLKALPRGCRFTGGSATKIVRSENKPIELEDTITLYPLYNGDLIELGKNVLLKFEISSTF